MSGLTPILLNDTLNVVALARETALARGLQDQADRLSPVVDGLRTVAVAARDSRPALAPSGPLAGDDFRALLEAAQAPRAEPADDSTSLDRSHVAVAMAAGGMNEIEIARQLGVARDEVRLMISLNRPRVAGLEASL
jgi:hypothetical protein